MMSMTLFFSANDNLSRTLHCKHQLFIEYKMRSKLKFTFIHTLPIYTTYSLGVS